MCSCLYICMHMTCCAAAAVSVSLYLRVYRGLAVQLQLALSLCIIVCVQRTCCAAAAVSVSLYMCLCVCVYRWHAQIAIGRFVNAAASSLCVQMTCSAFAGNSVCLQMACEDIY